MITYDYYRIFYFVAQYRSFTKAAELLNNNQPNITRCMNNLENELKCKLFVRSNRGVALTPEGQNLYKHVAIAYEQLTLGETELQKNQDLDSGLVTIGASETALRLMLLKKLEIFHEQYPHVRLRISNHSTPQAITALENGLVDFCVVTTPLNINKPLQEIPLLSFREILIGGLKYTSVAPDIHCLADLNNYPLVSLASDTGTREFYMQFFLNHGLPFKPDMEAATADQVLPMILHNLGIGFYPEELARESIARGEVIPINITEIPPERNICLIRDMKHPQSIAAKKLQDELINH